MVLAPWFGSSIVSTTMPSESFSQPIMLASLMVFLSPGEMGGVHGPSVVTQAAASGPDANTAGKKSESGRDVSDALDDGGHTHAAADAQGDQRVTGVAALQLVDHGAGDHGTGGTQRVAHGDGAAVDVQLLVRDLQIL